MRWLPHTSTEPLIHYRSFVTSFKGRKKIALVATGHFVFISGCEELTLSSATSQLIGSLRLLINFESSASPTLSVRLAGSMLRRLLRLSSRGRPYQHYFLQSYLLLVVHLSHLPVRLLFIACTYTSRLLQLAPHIGSAVHP